MSKRADKVTQRHKSENARTAERSCAVHGFGQVQIDLKHFEHLYSTNISSCTWTIFKIIFLTYLMDTGSLQGEYLMGQMHNVTMYRVEWRSLAVRGTENMLALRPLVG